eukprot:12385689-Karenia_brevis.AAC.1
MLHKYGERVSSGIFAGHHQQCGGGWDESVRVIDWQQLEGAESAKEVILVRVHYGEVVVLPGKWRDPLREGLCKQPDPGQKRSLRRRVITDSEPGDGEEEGKGGNENPEPAL